MKLAERYMGILNYFSENHPDAETELLYTSPYELLVAVILSAQCTDKRVNQTTPKLFQRFPNVITLAGAQIDEVFQYIKSISYPNNKAKHIVGMANMLLNDFGGEVPSEVTDLVKLPGVGRKTANVIASVIFNKAAMAVDTHVFRVSERLGLTKNAKNPHDAELQLIKNIPEYLVAKAHHWLILHGRYVCVARTPKCAECKIAEWCLYYSKNNSYKL
jgi:endonuclease III